MLTSAFSLPPCAFSRSLITAMAVRSVVGIGEIDLDVVLGACLPGQFSGKPWREQVITRQPAEEKRFTVAWPMPRLAPVRISVFRSSLGICAMPGKIGLAAATDRAAS